VANGLLMLTQNSDKRRDQLQIFCMDDLAPQDHLLRLIDKAIDWSFIYCWNWITFSILEWNL